MARIQYLIRRFTLKRYVEQSSVKSIDVFEKSQDGYIVRVTLKPCVKGAKIRWLTAIHNGKNTLRVFQTLDAVWSFTKAIGVGTIHVYDSSHRPPIPTVEPDPPPLE